MFYPGLVTPDAARALNELAARVGLLDQAADRPAAPFADRPWMKLTGYDPGTGYYAWTEQAKAADGTFYDKPDGRAGTVYGVNGATVTWMPAVETSGLAVPIPRTLRAERAVDVDAVGTVYHFSGSAPAFKQDTTTVDGVGPYTTDQTFADLLTTNETGLHLIVGGPKLFEQGAQIPPYAPAYTFPQPEFVFSAGSAGALTLHQPLGWTAYIPVLPSAATSHQVAVSQLLTVTRAPCNITLTVYAGSLSPGMSFSFSNVGGNCGFSLIRL